MKDIAGNVTNKISFEIDRRSWQNLDKFQKRIADVKKQLSGLSGNIKVNAVVSKFDRVQKAVGAKSVANKQQEYNAHVALFQRHQNKMAEVAAMNQRRVDNARNMMSSRLSTAGASDKVKTTAFNRFDTFSQQMLAGKMTATEFSRAVNQSTSSLLRQSSASKNAQMSMRGLRSELIQATAAYSAFAVGANVFSTGKELQSLEAGMLIFAKDGAGVKREMDWLVSKSQELGTNFMVAAQEYTKFSIVAKNKMSNSEAKRLFVAYSELATVQQMDPTRFHRGMNSLMQMLSKGSLMSEEVKGQFAEAAYGGVGLFAEALGMTEREFFKAMESGSLLSSEVLPKLATQMSKVAREGGALSAAQKTVNAEQQRFYTQLALAKRQFFEGGFGKAMAEIFSQMSSTLQSTNFASMGALIGGSLRGIADALNVLTLPLRGVINLFGALFGESGSKWLGYAAGIALVSVKVLALAKAVSFLAVAARALGATPVGLAISAVALGSLVALDKFVIQPSMQNPVDKMAQQAYSSKTNTQVNVVVRPDGNQFSRAVRADIMGYEYEKNADTVASIYA